MHKLAAPMHPRMDTPEDWRQAELLQRISREAAPVYPERVSPAH
jgi:hypothetical protein